LRYTKAKARLCRREGVNLFGPDKYDKILHRRGTKPGQSPTARPSKLSEYGRQLREKNKAKRIFGVAEKQFRRYFKKASSSKGVTGNRLLELLELRLDNVLFRAGLAHTRMQSRQFVNHRQFLVNNKAVDIPSYLVSVGDVITVRERFKDNIIFSDWAQRIRNHIPGWLEVDVKKQQIKVLRLPEAEETEQMIAVHMIIEFYSR